MESLFGFLLLLSFFATLATAIGWGVSTYKKQGAHGIGEKRNWKKYLLYSVGALVIFSIAAGISGGGSSHTENDNHADSSSRNVDSESKKKDESRKEASLKAASISSSKEESSEEESESRADSISESKEDAKAESRSESRAYSKSESRAYSKSESRAYSISTSKKAVKKTHHTGSNSSYAGDLYTKDVGDIVGNVNSKIYHVPGQAGYHMNSANAVHFKTEAQAQAAGYRKSLR